MSASTFLTVLLLLVLLGLFIGVPLSIVMGAVKQPEPKRRAPPYSPDTMVQPLLEALEFVARRSGDGTMRERAESTLRDWDVREESLFAHKDLKL